jgi:hypothetical protein
MHRSLRHASSAFKERNAVEVCAETGKAFFSFLFFVGGVRGRTKELTETTRFFSVSPKKKHPNETGTVFLNAAAWPRARDLSSAVTWRVVPNDNEGETEVESQEAGPSSLHHAVVVEVDRGVVTAAHDAWVTVSQGSSDGEEEGGKKKKKKQKMRFEATQLEMRELLRTERARGVDEKSGKEVFFRSVWRGWTREFELVASRVPRSAPEGWEHWRFRE